AVSSWLVIDEEGLLRPVARPRLRRASGPLSFLSTSSSAEVLLLTCSFGNFFSLPSRLKFIYAPAEPEMLSQPQKSCDPQSPTFDCARSACCRSFCFGRFPRGRKRIFPRSAI